MHFLHLSDPEECVSLRVMSNEEAASLLTIRIVIAHKLVHLHHDYLGRVKGKVEQQTDKGKGTSA